MPYTESKNPFRQAWLGGNVYLYCCLHAKQKDLLSYLISGSSEFESVETDFFNVAAIGSIINFDSPEDFTFNSTFMDVMKKYELKES